MNLDNDFNPVGNAAGYKNFSSIAVSDAAMVVLATVTRVNGVGLAVVTFTPSGCDMTDFAVEVQPTAQDPWVTWLTSSDFDAAGTSILRKCTANKPHSVGDAAVSSFVVDALGHFGLRIKGKSSAAGTVSGNIIHHAVLAV